MSFSAATAPEPCPCLCGLTFEALDRRNLLRQGTALCTAVGVNGQACNRPWAAHPREEGKYTFILKITTNAFIVTVLCLRIN